MIEILFTAPVLVFSTVEFINTPLLDGIITAFMPAQTQERIIAPTLCESSIPSNMTTETLLSAFFSIKSSKSTYFIGDI